MLKYLLLPIHTIKHMFKGVFVSEIKIIECEIDYYKAMRAKHLEELEYNKQKLARLITE